METHLEEATADSESSETIQETRTPNPDRRFADTTPEFQSILLSARLDVSRAEAKLAKSGSRTDFQAVTRARDELLRVVGLASKFKIHDGAPPTPIEIRALPSVVSRRKALTEKYGKVGAEADIIIDSIMSLVERQEIMRLDPDADLRDLMSIDTRIMSDIDHLRKTLPTKTEAQDRAIQEAVAATLTVVEAVLRNDPVKMRIILKDLSDEGIITAPGGKIGRASKRAG